MNTSVGEGYGVRHIGHHQRPSRAMPTAAWRRTWGVWRSASRP